MRNKGDNMKTNIKLFGIMALLAIVTIGFAFVGCDNGNDESQTFTVTFNADNGSANTTQTVTQGGKATKPADPAKANHTFVYWFDTATNTQWVFDTVITSNLTLKAKWDEHVLPATLVLTIKGVDITVKYQKKPSEAVPAQIEKIRTAATGLDASPSDPSIDTMDDLSTRNGAYSIDVKYDSSPFNGFEATDGQTLKVHETWLSNDETNLSLVVLRNAFNAMLKLPAVEP
jgi:uncharacterized repeat protein (TIGR02543 family)